MAVGSGRAARVVAPAATVDSSAETLQLLHPALDRVGDIGHGQQGQELCLYAFGVGHAAGVAVDDGEAVTHFQPFVTGGRTRGRRLAGYGRQRGGSLIGPALLHQRVRELPARGAVRPASK